MSTRSQLIFFNRLATLIFLHQSAVHIHNDLKLGDFLELVTHINHRETLPSYRFDTDNFINS